VGFNDGWLVPLQEDTQSTQLNLHPPLLNIPFPGSVMGINDG
jgi:hypothetical protein